MRLLFVTRFLFVTLCVLTLVACPGNKPPEPVTPAPTEQDGPVSVEGPASLSAATGERASFELENAGTDVLDFTISVRNNAANPSAENWFSLSQKEGRLEPGDKTVLVLTLIKSLPEGRYKSRLDVTYQGGVTSFEVVGVIGDDDKGDGSAQIIGTLTTDNSLISVNPKRSLQPELKSLTAQPQASYVPGQLLIKYADQGLSTQGVGVAARESLQRRYGLRVLQRRAAGSADLVDIGSRNVLELAQELSAESNVDYAEPVYYLYTTALPNDELLSEQWALSSAGLPVAWSVETGSDADVVVAVIDSGFDTNHPDLRGRFLPGIDFCAEARNGTCAVSSDTDPGHGNRGNTHGTHVAGILGASANNNRGIAGAAYGAGVKLLPVKIFSDAGTGATVTTFVNGIRWAAGLEVEVNGETLKNPNPADIISMSLGAFFDSRAVQEAIDEARAAGAISLAAAGNNGINQIMSPAAAEGVIAVGSINPNFRRSCFSNYGSGKNFGPGKLDLVTAGGEGAALSNSLGVSRPTCKPATIGIYSTNPADNYSIDAGTSMATPLAAGVAALILAQNPDLSATELETELLASTYFEPSYMNEAEYGAGVLRAEYALGLSGPGDEVTVSAKGASDALDTVKLDLLGGSGSYTLDALSASEYLVEAKTGGSGTVLSARENVSVKAGEAKRLDLRLGVR